MKRPILMLVILLLFNAAFIAGWIWREQATSDGPLKIIHIPRWIAGNKTVSYSVAIGASQIKPYGTVWKLTEGDGSLSDIPIYTKEDLARYMARNRKSSSKPKISK